jgi:ferredoxin
VSGTEQRRVGNLTIRIDRDLCVAFGDCIELAPEAFVLDSDDVAVFVSPENVPRERLLEACKTCPVDALIVVGPDGRQIVP